MCSYKDKHKNSIEEMQKFYLSMRSFIPALLVMGLSLSAAAHNRELSEPLSAKKIDIGVMLKWSTENEAEADFFVLEKSLDGSDFKVLTEIQPTGVTNKGSNYSFIDLFPEDESIYYRLKTVYKDGRATAYQPVKAIHIPTTNFVISKMNSSSPSSNWSVNLEMFISGALVYELTSLDGMIIEKGIKRVSEGYNELSFSLEDWSDGVFTLSLEMAGDRKTLTVQKIGNSTIQVSTHSH